MRTLILTLATAAAGLAIAAPASAQYYPPQQGQYGAPYGNAYGYQGQGYQDPRYAAQGDLTFRCNVDYRGVVSNVRINRNRAAYNRGY